MYMGLYIYKELQKVELGPEGDPAHQRWIFYKGGGELGGDDARRHPVDTDATWGHLSCQRLSEAQQGCLADGIHADREGRTAGGGGENINRSQACVSKVTANI